jgi:hypothetical protein
MSYRNVVEQAFDQNGDPLPGALLYFYNPGTLVARTVYSDAALTIAVTQPAVADSAGKFAQLFLQAGTYRYQLKTSAGVTVNDMDNVDPGLSGSSGALSLALGGTGATTAAGARTNLGVPSTTVTTGLDSRLTVVEQVQAAPALNTENVVAYAATVALSFTTKRTQSITLAGNITLSAPTATTGQDVVIVLVQDATGGRTAVWNSAYKFSGGTPPALSRTANAVDVFYGYVRGASEIQIVDYKIQDARPSSIPDIILEDQKASGTAGGTATSGSDETRTLNTEVYDRLNICALASNQFTISAPGTYYVEWEAPAYDVGGAHQSILRDITGVANLTRGSSAYGPGVTTLSTGAYFHTITASNTYEIRHRITTTKATTGYGQPASFGTETYTRVKIWKVA